MFVQNFDRDFEAIVNPEQAPFAFARFHDGEYAILDNLPYSAASKWTLVGQEVWLRDELYQTLRSPLDRFFIGISPPCCVPQATHYYRKHSTLHRSHMTYATIFMNRNYRRVPRLRARFQDAVIVSSGNGDIKVPANGVTTPWNVDAVVTELLSVDRPILVAAGPCANLIIHRYWATQEKSKRQFILDVGSSFDLAIHGKKTRHFHDMKSKSLYHSCAWDKWAAFGPVTQEQRDHAKRIAEQHDRFKSQSEHKPKLSSKVRTRYITPSSPLITPGKKMKVKVKPLASVGKSPVRIVPSKTFSKHVRQPVKLKGRA